MTKKVIFIAVFKGQVLSYSPGGLAMARNKTKKPIIKIVHNFIGCFTVAAFGLIPDLVNEFVFPLHLLLFLQILLHGNTRNIAKSRMFLKRSSLSPIDRNIIILALISFLACFLSALFLFAILLISGLTMQKNKRIVIFTLIEVLMLACV
jgi:hypothetical protein